MSISERVRGFFLHSVECDLIVGLAKVGQLRLAKVGQIFLAKVGLAKVGIGQSRPIRMAKVGLAKETLLVVASHAVVQTLAGWQQTEAATN